MTNIRPVSEKEYWETSDKLKYLLDSTASKMVDHCTTKMAVFFDNKTPQYVKKFMGTALLKNTLAWQIRKHMMTAIHETIEARGCEHDRHACRSIADGFTSKVFLIPDFMKGPAGAERAGQEIDIMQKTLGGSVPKVPSCGTGAAIPVITLG